MLQGDATYLIVNNEGQIEKYGLNAVCTHLGCVVPWNNVRGGPKPGGIVDDAAMPALCLELRVNMRMAQQPILLAVASCWQHCSSGLQCGQQAKRMRPAAVGTSSWNASSMVCNCCCRAAGHAVA